MLDTATPETSAAQTQAEKFLDLIKARETEFEKGWWKQAEEAEKIYEAEKSENHKYDTPYNILYSNTEVLLPSLYSATPKPDVRARFKADIKPLPELINRFLSAASDSGEPGADTLNIAMQDAVLSALIPGMGYVRIRNKPEAGFPIVYESGSYKNFIWGKASRWSKVPWVAFKHPMKKDQMFKQFNIDAEAQQAGYTPTSTAEDERDDCCVYEFWDKASRKVYFISEEWREREIQATEDPLQLKNFFPTPGPLLLTCKPGKLSPITLYNYYRNQAEELNRVTVRLNKVLSAIRVRGAYNGLLGNDLKNLLSSDDLDNDLIPAAEAGLLAQSGGFEKHIWLLPIEKMIQVAQELYKAREAIKQVIYELTGISDIIRGSSVASETATAQDLKNKWGTVRLRRMQAVVADYARDLFRLTIDCAATIVPAKEWASITQMQLPTVEDKQTAYAQLMHLRQMPPMPGQPPQQQNPQIAQLQQKLQTPTIEDLLGKISSDLGRTFIVNIQTSSTIDLDTSQDKAEVGEFMNAMGQMLAGLQPLMMMGPTGVEAAKSIIIAVCQQYKFGIDIADVIGKIQSPPPQQEEPKGPPPPSPEEQEVIKQEAQLKLQRIMLDREVLQAKHELAMAEIQTARERLGIDIDRARLQLQSQQAKVSAAPPSKGNQNAAV